MNSLKQLVFLFLLFYPVVSIIINNKHQIRKRSLLFPQYTILQFTYGVSAPVIFPKRSINLSLCVQCNFELPFNTTQLRPTVVSARTEDPDYDLDRKTFYKYIIAVLDGVGLNGEECLLRSICEVAEIPMHIEDSNSLLENVVHYLLTPSEDFVVTPNLKNSSYDQFLEAENLGKNNGICYEAFPACSISLIAVYSGAISKLLHRRQAMGIVHAKENQEHSFGVGIARRDAHYDNTDNENREIMLDGVKARVDRIHINGLGRTKNDIVEDAVKDLFTAQDFQEVLLKAHTVRTRLDSLGCFRNIAVYIDTSKGPKASPDGLEVTFHVKELKRIVGGVNTQVGENEGSLVVGLRAPNLFGRGERLQTEYSYGSKRSNNFNLSFIKPFRGKRHPVFTASIYQAISEWPVSGYKELNKGLILDFGFHSLPLVKHNFQWDAAIRDLSVLSRSSSFDVREQSGINLKSALRHILSIDLRDETIFPSAGSLFQVTSEFAGVGGNIGFIKNDAYIQTNYSILEDFVLQATISGGILNGLGNDWKISISDMYYLGGPLSLRGFQMRGVGPHSEGDALGSGWYWSTGLHLYTPLPFRPGRGGFGELFRTHFFVNAGNIGSHKPDEDRPSFEQISQNIRIAYGVGIAIRLGQMARVEVNYCFPHSFDRADSPQHGVQFGIGVQFL